MAAKKLKRKLPPPKKAKPVAKVKRVPPKKSTPAPLPVVEAVIEPPPTKKLGPVYSPEGVFLRIEEI